VVRLYQRRDRIIEFPPKAGSLYDSLTGLVNRRMLVERLEQALRRSALDRKTHALIFVDMDRFKSINDSRGVGGHRPDRAGAREVMKKLNRLGVRLAIDDFGTGHSSLAYLKQFPVHEVKVDRTFVQGVAESPVDSAIVRAVIDLANAMKISAVAEGVETKNQVTGLKRLGCAVGQGFYFSQPLHAAEFDRLLACHFSHNAASAGPVPTGQGAPAQAAGPLALPGR